MPFQLITVTGTEVIAKAFRQLEPKVARNVVRKAVRGVNQPIRAMIRNLSPARTGAMKKGTRIVSSKGPRGFGTKTIAMATLQGQATKGKAGHTTWYAYLIEKGWMSGKRHRKGQKTIGYSPHQGNLGARGVHKIPGKFQIRKTLKALEEPQKQRLIVEIWNGIEREASAH